MGKVFCGSFILVLAAVFVFFGQVVCADDFTHQEVLDEEGKFHLFWKFDDEKIEFEAQVQTTGWVGLGLSPNGGMPGSDIAIGWVKDGTAHLTDRYAEEKAQPPVDESQDWELVSGYENGTHTVLRFNRKLTTCDVRDRVINGDTMRVLWAWHDDDPEDESGVGGPPYHGANRGVRSTVLLSNIIDTADSAGELKYTFDLTMKNVSIPADQDTTYWCRVFELPNLASKHHVIKLEPIITHGNEGVVHHFLVYRCDKHRDVTILPEEHPGHDCRSPNMPLDWGPCYEGTLLAAWAVGGGTIVVPDHAGFPMGEEDDSSFVLMELHYDNPQLASGIYDSSGLRLTYTPELRNNNMGVLGVGLAVTKYHVIPPHTEAFVSVGFCNTDCLDAHLEELGQPIHIVGVTFHSHLLGVKMNARLIHEGVETDIARDDNYDFNLQFTRMMKEEITVYPGDTLLVECTYNSMNRDQVTYGGYATTDEMCEVFFQYYPKFHLSFCDSSPSLFTTLGFAGIRDVDIDYGNLEVNITAPANMVHMSYEQAMEAVQWTDQMAETFSQTLLYGFFPHHTRCKATHQSSGISLYLADSGCLKRTSAARGLHRNPGPGWTLDLGRQQLKLRIGVALDRKPQELKMGEALGRQPRELGMVLDRQPLKLRMGVILHRQPQKLKMGVALDQQPLEMGVVLDR
ncbi:MOXD1 [Branchiostoma lanceolatum]|uniref:MOXD1 protein n=1 Tax=Branchiostoma lanceolatum TaxID=7740 RepID=A0A8J9YK79_BRALA|nr:MOXD1 [Branchiostoma lanceolatum]